jgi:carboxynorspermidine decarboxylase
MNQTTLPERLQQVLTQIKTPAYVLDENKLIHNLEVLHRVEQEAGVKILVAQKGFSFWESYPLLKQYISGATASSLHEALLCAEEMKEPAHLCCPLYIPEEYDEMMRISSHVTFNSLNQYKQYVHQTPEEVAIAIRINPEYSEVETDLYNPASPNSRLGVTAEELGSTLPERVTGLHMHALCENDSYTLERTWQALETNFSRQLHQASWLNLGGGHHITREDYDVDHLIALLKSIKEKYDLEIYLEPGEAFGWQTGYLVTKILDIIPKKEQTTLMINSSFTCHMPDCLEMPYKPKVYDAGDATDGSTAYRIGGMSCLAGDQMGDYAFTTPPAVDDILVFDDMIHYTMVKTSTFNGVPLPDIGKIDQDGNYKVIRQFTYQDFRNRLG